jgi:RHS repeat-associated protein
VPVGTYNATAAATTLPAGTTLLGFPGQQQTLPDLYYNQYRDYDPTTGRYIQADPIGLAGDANPYSYAGSNPVRFTDALGLQRAIPRPMPMPFPGRPASPWDQDGDGMDDPAEEIALRIERGLGRFVEWVRSCFRSGSSDRLGRCPPCRTISGRIVPVGTIGYRPLDTPSRPQHGISGPHHNILRANQNPNNCRCFWAPVGAVPEGQLPPGAIPVEDFTRL